ncbi:MAG TPA: peptide-methionine (S)-S-oxide reductase MsrA [Candidatus Saccharimonadales bacterium]|nr:peptide-methionine (S)-S-oxide reductase MsrA [Candidatus Saccharimonadales bacterium]
MANLQQATLGGGCYWCLEAFYQRVNGVEKVVSGYSGGHVDNVTVQQVYDGGTGHAEVVQVDFDPEVISFKEILEIFFVMHDPTTLNRQGNDVGEIYRSVIFYHDADQKQIAEDMIANFAPTLYEDPIVTELKPFEAFWPADESMQDYYNRNPNAGYCMVVIDPKIQKLRQKFASKLKPAV